MKEIFEEILKLAEKDEPFVLSTVIQTKGSTPQKAGAKLLIRQDGTALGTLGGGCVEGDIWYLGKQLLNEKGKPVYREYELNEEISERGGLVCGGTMWFFVEPLFSPSKFKQYAKKITDAYKEGPAVALATLVKDMNQESKIGNRLLVFENGSFEGDLGDTNIESEVVRMARKIAASGELKLLKTESGTEIYIEGFTTSPNLVLMGAGHVNKAVSNLAATLGFHIFIVDDREEYANKNRFPEADLVFVTDYEGGLHDVPVNSNTFIVIATRGHKYDDLALSAALKTKARFVGLMGSKRKTILIYKNLIKEGIPEQKILDIHAPIGLDIGALSPEELAVSIMAEIIMIRRGGTGSSLRFEKDYLRKVLSKDSET